MVPRLQQILRPADEYWQNKFADETATGQLVFVKIHTVFEGRNYQTVKKLKSYVIKKGITIPVGVDRHVGDRRIPETMRRYKTRGTPEMVIIDGDGVIRFQEFGSFDPAAVEPMITEMLDRARA